MHDEPLIFRTCAGGRHGWGNLVRMAAFADFCRRRGGHDCRFVVQGPPEAVELLEQRGFGVSLLGDDPSPDEEERCLDACGPAGAAFMEMLDCGPERQRILARHAESVIVFDDLLDHEFVCDLVVCGQALPGYGNTGLGNPDTRFLTGLDYFLLDPSFATGPRKPVEEVRRLLVCFGGGAYDVALLKTAMALRDMPELEPTVVLGYGRTDLADRLGGLLPGARFLAGVDDMAGLMRQCDLAVVSAGYLKIEAAATRTPAVMLATQWHQIPLGEAFSALCGMPFGGYMGFVDPRDIAGLVRSMMDRETRARVTERAAALVDGRGMERVYAEVFGPKVAA